MESLYINIIINSMVQNPPWKYNSCSASHEIRHLVWNTKADYYNHRSLHDTKVITFKFHINSLPLPATDLIRNNQRYCKIYTIHLQAVPQPRLIKYYASSAVVSGCESNPHSNPPPSHMSKTCFLNFSVLAYSFHHYILWYWQLQQLHPMGRMDNPGCSNVS